MKTLTDLGVIRQKWDKETIITSDMIKKYEYTNIGKAAFYGCHNLNSISLPNNVTCIDAYAFSCCRNLISITLPKNITTINVCAFEFCGINLPRKYDIQGRLIAYKGFDKDMQCRGFHYVEGQTYETERAILCNWGFHACINPLDIFNYYSGEIDKDVYIHEVYLEGVSIQEADDSKVVAKKITIGRRLNIEDINRIIKEK